MRPFLWSGQETKTGRKSLPTTAVVFVDNPQKGLGCLKQVWVISAIVIAVCSLLHILVALLVKRATKCQILRELNLLRIRARLYSGQATTTGCDTLPTTAVGGVDNLQRRLGYFGRRRRGWWLPSYVGGTFS